MCDERRIWHSTLTLINPDERDFRESELDKIFASVFVSDSEIFVAAESLAASEKKVSCLKLLLLQYDPR